MDKKMKDWLTENVKKIKGDAKTLALNYKKDAEFLPLSILKLIALAYVIPVYTNIIGTKKIFKEMIYVDLFSGSGIKNIKNKTMNKTKPFLGSPFIAINQAKKPFDFMYFVDIDKDNCTILEQRLEKKSKQEGFEWLVGRYQVIHADANEAINQILNHISKSGVHSFIFIDPCSTELTMKSIKTIAEKTRSDLFINIMAHEIFRGIESSKSSTKSKSLDNWFGSNNWIQLKNRDEIVLSYSKKISHFHDKNDNQRLATDLIPIKDPTKVKEDFYYYLLYATIITSGKSAWMRAIASIRDKMLQTTSVDVFHIINNLYFGQNTISDYKW